MAPPVDPLTDSNFLNLKMIPGGMEKISGEEYVSSLDFSGIPVVMMGDQILPFWIDELTRDARDDVYELMLLDPKVKSSVLRVIFQILYGGIQILPEVEFGAVSDAEYEKSEKRATSATQMLNDLETPFITDVCVDLLLSMITGNRIAEVTYWDMKETPKKGQHWIKSIKTKSRRAIAFVVDQFNNVKGFTNTSTVVTKEGSDGPEREFRLLPKEKFVWISWRPHNSDPRGQSEGRSVYEPWLKKIQFIGEYVKFAEQFGSPSIVGTTAEGASVRPKRDPSSGEIVMENGNPVMIDPAVEYRKALVTWRNGKILIKPFGSELELMRPQVTGEVFDNALDRWDGEIEESLTLRRRHTGVNGPQDESVAQDNEGLMVYYGKIALAHAIRNRILKPWVVMNEGEEAGVPIVTIPGTAQQDFARDGEAVARLHGSGYFDPTQYAQTDVRLGFKPRRLSPQEIKKMRENILNGRAQVQDPSAGGSPGPKGTRVSNKPGNPNKVRPKKDTSGMNSTKDVNLLTPPNK